MVQDIFDKGSIAVPQIQPGGIGQGQVAISLLYVIDQIHQLQKFRDLVRMIFFGPQHSLRSNRGNGPVKGQAQLKGPAAVQVDIGSP